MGDKQMIRRLMDTMSRLQVPVTVEPLREDLQPVIGEPVTEGNRLVLRLQAPAIVLSCEATVPGGREMLMLAGALAAGDQEEHFLSAQELYAQAMRGSISQDDFAAKGRMLNLPVKLDRCLIAFQSAQDRKQRLYPLVESVLPLQERDVLVELDGHTVVLVKDLRDYETQDEVFQLGLALCDTLSTDAPGKVILGISSRFMGLQEVNKRCQEALFAIAMGSIFKRQQSVFAYERMALERFLLQVSPSFRKQEYEKLFNPEHETLFNDEMMYTIDMFMQQDLNLSETARQLYIHRNTLVYRLDKIQKETGMNLRSFRDAMTFKLLMEMKNCADDE